MYERTHTFEDGSTMSGPAVMVERAIQFSRDRAATERAWIDQLRAAGVKGAHPDDGWVDRDKNRFVLCYPQFNDGLAVGDLFALGWQDRWRIVRITKTEEGDGPIIRASYPGPYYWYFDEQT